MLVDDSETEAQSSTLRISGMDCPDCAVTLEKKVRAIAGVRLANINFATARLDLEMDPEAVSLERIIHAIDEAGYGAEPDRLPIATTPRPFYRRLRLKDWLTVVSGIFVALGFVSSIIFGAGSLAVIFYAAAIVTGGYFTARRGLSSLRSLTFDINFLMTLAVLGAAAIGDWAEGATVVFLFSLANALESYTMDRTRNSIRELMELTPNEALVDSHGHLHRLPVAQIKVGDLMVVRPGEKIAMDGIVVGGASSVNQASITGESLPVEKKAGDAVFAGTLNQRGALRIQVTRPFEDNTISRIIHLIEEAQSQRAPAQQFIDRFARYYTPTVIAIAIAIAVVPPIFGNQEWHPWLYRALALLVVSCPCALVISTPVSIVSAIANASRHGVLIKGGAHLEQTGNISVVAFDKTGTLTNGQPTVTEILPLNGYAPDRILAIAAAVEHHSEHPMAEAIIRKARAEGIAWPSIADFEALTGLGARARVEDTEYFVGSHKLFEDMGLFASDVAERLAALQSDGNSVVLLGTREKLLGAMAIEDDLRESSRATIEQLHHCGIERIVMLTGDNQATATAIAGQLGIDEFRAGLLPEDKVGAVKELLADYRKVAMIGDGVNDAPALATATVGIVMGMAGADTALETADIALMADDLSKLPFVMRLSRRTMRIVKQNITLALFIKLIFLGLAFPGWLTLWLAVLGDMGVSLLVIGNGMRLLHSPSPKRVEERLAHGDGDC